MKNSMINSDNGDGAPQLNEVEKELWEVVNNTGNVQKIVDYWGDFSTKNICLQIFIILRENKQEAKLTALNDEFEKLQK